MASNTLPTKLDSLFTLGEDMTDGLHDLQTPIGILQHTEVRLRTNLNGAMDKQLAFNSSKSARVALTTAQTIADSNGRAFIGLTRDLFAVMFGSQWSAVWEPTGFPNQSLAIPATLAERQALLGSLRAFLTVNPTLANEPANITAARAAELFTALSNARSAVNAGIADSAQKKTERDTAVTALRVRMRGVIDELASLLTPDDPRWFQFGLVPPALSDAPDVPENLILTAGSSPGQVLADWSDSPRAVSYRVYKKITGVDTEFVLADSPSDSDATLTGLPSGQTVQIQVVAVGDNNLVSPVSETKQIVVP